MDCIYIEEKTILPLWELPRSLEIEWKDCVREAIQGYEQNYPPIRMIPFEFDGLDHPIFHQVWFNSLYYTTEYFVEVLRLMIQPIYLIDGPLLERMLTEMNWAEVRWKEVNERMHAFFSEMDTYFASGNGWLSRYDLGDYKEPLLDRIAVALHTVFHCTDWSVQRTISDRVRMEAVPQVDHIMQTIVDDKVQMQRLREQAGSFLLFPKFKERIYVWKESVNDPNRGTKRTGEASKEELVHKRHRQEDSDEECDVDSCGRIESGEESTCF